ncbi:MAG TPA: DUF1761 domain-containing protein [Vicinamibacterales bacterium]
MNWLTLGGLNWLGIGLAFVAVFVLGFWWYSPAGFLPVWTRLQGITDADMKGVEPVPAFGGVVLANLLGTVLLAVLMKALAVESAAGGALTGLVLGLVFKGGAHAGHNGFALRPPLITLIDTAHDAVGLAVAGFVLALVG